MDLMLPRLNALRDSADEEKAAGAQRRYLTGLSGVGVSVNGGADGLGVGVSVNGALKVDAKALGMGVSAKSDADMLNMGVIDSTGSAHVVMSSQDKVIVGYWLVRAALNVALSRGANKNKLLRGTGIFEDALQHHSLLSTKQYSSLLVNVQSQARGGDVSFLLGGAFSSQWLSSPLNALKACENVEQLLLQLTQRQTYRWCSLPLCQFQRFENADQIMLVPQFTGVSSKQLQFSIEVAFASVVALMKSIANKRIRLSFSFTESRPRNIADYETHLGLKLSFNRAFNSICIEKDVLRQPLELTAQSDCSAESHVSLEGVVSNSATQTKEGASIELQNRLSLPDFVRRYGYASSNTQAANIGLPELAETLNVSVATLKRKLKEYGTSYRALCEEVQRNHALLLLSVHKVSNETAANAMGINDLPNFRRTVKRLTGKTPSELRI
ncbi:AraC family transcriptional regulator [Alteromonas macleodii]|uniref:AraC family transcriptional regulator n=1 Tax=Alteromonas macleodii TaxID=28108 RepID=UPI00127925F3|nr:AraC family transcriptional regulator [Alteromonas macleodii]CAI2389739.1 Helix-turn-helix domain-containing protein [Alteromonas macleodii]CAI3949834.1 Helix-turn-helix domain-containing protein [Alteromonas macleodii]CAI3950812.1 Helix-turn-helix domain-containing protein [Alteromonas macleodii]CAI3950879.1 Helix-turn-helix domain-containing protein [Alteromonas macleodii]VTO39335.1 Helix-turn-helix domain-containing protein [Alteromonas macleodii]